MAAPLGDARVGFEPRSAAAESTRTRWVVGSITEGSTQRRVQEPSRFSGGLGRYLPLTDGIGLPHPLARAGHQGRHAPARELYGTKTFAAAAFFTASGRRS